MSKLSNYIYYQEPEGIIYCGDCVDIIPLLSPIDLVVTSPPYDNMRDYKGYSFDFERTADLLWQAVPKGGIVVWVVGDEVIKGSESGTSFRQALYFKSIGFNLHDTMIYQKANFKLPEKIRYHQIFEYMFILSKNKPKTFNPICDRKNVNAGRTNFGKNRWRQIDGTMKEGPKSIYKDYGMRYNIWRMSTAGQENAGGEGYLTLLCFL